MAAATKKKEQVDAAPVQPEGTCAVDIRVFLLTITMAMSVAFMAGIFVHLPLEKFLQRPSPTTVENQTPRSLKLSPADLKTAGSHSPSGQHLLVDIKGIEAAFLDSEERLTDAMVRTVEAGGLSLLSYHCHKLDPAGISCVGILLESHISFHTWPEEGVITLDLFTCGANPLMPVLPIIERLFGIGENIETKWSHDLRGFRSIEERKANYLDDFSDLAVWILSPLEVHSKKLIYSNLTKYQRVDIWDIVEKEDIPSYEDGIKYNLQEGDQRWKTPDLYTPDRILFLDGTLQSIGSTESVYHEALVHPAMFAHAGPKNVAVLGGGEGATVREVLKHKTVEKVTMIELDEELVAISRQYLPKLSDCSDIAGRADNCFDDNAVNLVVDNAVDYFHDQYGPDRSVKDASEPFDVLIVDALDPEDDVIFAQDLYADNAFVSAMLRSMSDDGVLILQTGTAPEISDPRADKGSFTIREELLSLFENHPDVATIHAYEEAKCGFLEPHSFLIICKHISCLDRWYADSDRIDYEIYGRIMETKSGSPTLKYYDGVTQQNYQVPPKAWEAVYCRREPTPFECAHRSLDFNTEIHNLSLSENEGSFRVDLQHNEEGEVVGSAVIAKVDIPKGSFIMPEDSARSLALTGESIDGITVSASKISAFDEFSKFIESKSHRAATEGASFHYLEVGGPTLIRQVDGKGNVDRWVPAGKKPPYSPVYDRRRMSFEVFLVASQDIAAGTELTRSKNLWRPDV